MAKLTYKDRKSLDQSQFVFPDTRKYPMHDRQHGISALQMAQRFATPEQKKLVRSAVCKRYPDIPSCKVNVLESIDFILEKYIRSIKNITKTVRSSKPLEHASLPPDMKFATDIGNYGVKQLSKIKRKSK